MYGFMHVTSWRIIICVAAITLTPRIDIVAQEAASEDSMDEVIVTGSRIARRDFFSPSPIMTVDADSLRLSGQPTLMESLNQLPQFTPAQGRGTPEASEIVNLRGLGAFRTLTLMNSRRVGSDGFSNTLDLGQIPKALVERVEIITGGASTVYGSDAVAGVVNFLIRDDYDGFNLDISAYQTAKGDSDTYDVGAVYGRPFADGRGHLTLFGGYLDRDGTRLRERELTAQSLIDDGMGNIVPGGARIGFAGTILAPPANFGSGPVQLTFEPDGSPREFMDPDDLLVLGLDNYLQVPVERAQALAMLSFDLSDRIELYSELSYNRIEADSEHEAPLFVGGIGVLLDSPMLTDEAREIFAANYRTVAPGAVGFLFGRVFDEAGHVLREQHRTSGRFLAGVRGAITDAWDYDAWITKFNYDRNYLFRRGILRSRIQQGLLVDPLTGECLDPSNGCVPVNPFGAVNVSAEAVAFLRAPDIPLLGDREQEVFGAYVSGPAGRTPAGAIETAFGLEWRNDVGSFMPNDLMEANEIVGHPPGISEITGSEKVAEIYAEARIPLIDGASATEYLGLEVGGRYSRYSNAGSTDAWKLGFDWQPLDIVRIRAMEQRSVRAPNLGEAFRSRIIRTSFFPESFDRCSVSADPVGAGIVEKCIIQGIPEDQIGIFEATPGWPTEVVTGGNPALIPEVGETLTVGAVLTPPQLPNWQFSVDFFELDLKDAIDRIFAWEACMAQTNVNHDFCNRITRDPVTFDIAQLDDRDANIARNLATGFDLQLATNVDLPSALAIGDAGASLGINFVWTHGLRNSLDGMTFNCRGRYGWPCTQVTQGRTNPEHRTMTNLSYQSGKVAMQLGWRWIGGSTNASSLLDEFLGGPPVEPAQTEIGSKSYVDYTFNYELSDELTLRLNVANLFDTSPPLMVNPGLSNTDLWMYDIFGRSVTLSMSLSLL